MQTNYFDLSGHNLTGINLIEASAGTGKTYTITGLFLRLLLEKELSVRDILVVTFTEAATEELKDRIRKGISGLLDALKYGEVKDNFQQDYIPRIKDRTHAIKLLKEALINFDEANIFTIHSFCRRMLNENAFESGILFDVELIKDDSEIKREIVEDYWRKYVIDQPSYMISYLKNNSVSKITFDSLLHLADRIEDLSNIKLIPEDNFDDKNLELKYAAAINKLRITLSENYDEIIKIFSNTSVFNQQKYKFERMAALIDALKQHLSGKELPPPEFEKLEKFTLEEISSGIKKGQKVPEDNFDFFRDCEELLNIHKAYKKILPIKKVQFIRFVARELSERKNAKNVQSFSDLLVNLYKALEGNNGEMLAHNIRTKFKAALIDEFQDTDPIQFAIFEKVFTGYDNILFLIGDPKQAIYGFRGADIFAYLKASQNEAYTKRTLGTNYRSQPDLIGAVNLIFSKENSFLFKEIEYINVSSPSADVKPEERLTIDGKPYSPLHLWNASGSLPALYPEFSKMSDEEIITYSTTAEIKRLLRLGREGRALIGQRPIEEKDIAVLVKKNIQAVKMQRSLTEAGIPGVIYNSGNVFKSHEATEIERLLRAIADPGSSRLIKTALVTDMIGLSIEEIDKFNDNENLFEEWLEKFRDYSRMWHSHGFIKMFRELTGKEKVMPRLMEFVDGERRNTNLLHLMELLHQAEASEKLSPHGLIKWMCENMNSEDNEKEEHQLRLESDEKAVKIITVHKSKGLEYSIVFLPFMWSTTKDPASFLFHDINNNYEHTWELGSDNYATNKQLYTNEKLAEDLRLFYVAITRAKNCCYLVLKEGSGTTTMDYLFSSTDELVEKSNGTISLSDIPVFKDESGPLSYLSNEPILEARIFNGKITCKSHIASYTSLISGHADTFIPLETDIPFEDEETDISPKETKNDDEGEITAFSFDKGIRAGLCIHEMMEEIDFSLEDKSSKVQEILGKYRFKTEFTPAVCEMLENTLSVPLNGEIILKNIPSSRRIHEMEFYFPMCKVSGKTLAEKFDELYHDDEYLKDFNKYLWRLRQDEIEGFMNGLLDLLFEYNGKYYIVDWKTNHLGSSIEAYGKGQILHAMKNEMYILQYHIYCAAADRYLKLALPEYDYDKHFGGVFYLFMRGIDKSKAIEHGVYFHRPEKRALSILSVEHRG